MDCLESKTLQRLERENKEQLDTIEKILNALNLPNLFQVLTFTQKDLNGSQKIQFLDESFIKKRDLQNEANKKQILELEAELQQKQYNYKNKEEQINEYLKNVKENEELLEKNERERAELLNQIQNLSESNVNMNRSLTLEDLEDKVAAKKQEYEKLKIENIQTKEKCEKLKDQLQNSYNYSKALQKQLNEVRSQYAAESPIIKFRNNEETIENLQNQIERANKKIKNLTDDNEMLKKLLQSDDEEIEDNDGEENEDKDDDLELNSSSHSNA